MKFLTLRFLSFQEFLITIALIINSYWLEFYKGIAPCPLCSLQRLAFILLSIIFLIATLTPNQKRKIHLFCAGSAAFISLIGLSLAGRQVWLQHLPAELNSDCGVSLEYLMKVLPFHQAMSKALLGSAECGKIEWTHLNLSLAEWSLLFFIFFLTLSLSKIRYCLKK